MRDITNYKRFNFKNMKQFRILFIFAVLAFAAISCKKDEVQAILNQPVTAPVLSLDKTDVVLLKDNANDQILKASWTKPVYGFNAALSYKLSINVKDSLASKAINIDLGGFESAKNFTHADLNSKLLLLGLAPEVVADVEMQVTSYVQSTLVPSASNKVYLKATPYTTRVDLSSTWGVVGGATPNGWNGPDIPFYKANQSGILKAWATLNDGEIKFRENNDWANNVGDNGADGTFEPNGASIAVTKGIYVITMNLNNNTYTIVPLSFGLVGNATPNGWGGPDVPMQYNPYDDTWNVIAKLTAGDMKFRLNNDWGTNYGDDGANGVMDLNGANIVIASAGTYIVKMNLTDKSYSITPGKIFGIVGNATAGGWGGPDAKFNYNFITGIWSLYNIPLTVGDIKFRADDDWAVNYGSEAAGKLKLNGGNIPITEAGNYDFTLDFNDAADPKFTSKKR